MDIDYKYFMDMSQQLSADLEARLEEEPDDEELREMREFLGDRYKTLLFVAGA